MVTCYNNQVLPSSTGKQNKLLDLYHPTKVLQKTPLEIRQSKTVDREKTQKKTKLTSLSFGKGNFCFCLQFLLALKTKTV